MARPHIEFVQCQNVQWTDCPDGSSIKLLNADCESGEETFLVRFPAGWISRTLATNDRAEEFFVLSGSVATDDVMHRHHAYGFLPRGSGLGLGRSDEGAVVRLFRHGRDDPDSSARTAEPIAIDTPSMPWDTSTYDPALEHLRLARKILRLGPNDSGRTFLLTGLPHGVPDEDSLPSEYHDHAEEMFMISGEMWAPEGRMAACAYFYRPPGIEHGPHVSETGFSRLCARPARTGSSRTGPTSASRFRSEPAICRSSRRTRRLAGGDPGRHRRPIDGSGGAQGAVQISDG